MANHPIVFGWCGTQNHVGFTLDDTPEDGNLHVVYWDDVTETAKEAWIDREMFRESDRARTFWAYLISPVGPAASG